MGVDVGLEACDNAEVVACALHAPQEIGMAGFVDCDGGAVGQHHVELAEIVTDHAIYTFERSMATTKTGAKHADAVASTCGGNVAILPEVLCCLPIVDTSTKPRRFAIRLDTDVSEPCHVDLDAVERPKGGSTAVATVYG